MSPRTGAIYDGGSAGAVGRRLAGLVRWRRLIVTAYASYRQAQEVTGASRDFSACTLVEAGTSFQCLLDGTTSAGQFVRPVGVLPAYARLGNGHAFRPLAAPGICTIRRLIQDLQRPDTALQRRSFFSDKFNDAAMVYAEAQYTDDK